MPSIPSNDLFHFHKAALRPLLHTLDTGQTATLFNDLESFKHQEFVTFLQQQGLASMWLSFLLTQETLPANWQATIKDLQQDALRTAANQLMQRKISADTHNALRHANINYLIFKGANLRHTIYTDPTHRPVCDIDILVRNTHKYEAVKALLDAGFSCRHLAENISHETSLLKNDVCIDLHWHLLRPGRTRINLSDYLFDQRQPFGELEGLSNEASLLVMLIHPAITKYVNGSAASLRHLVDIHRLAQQDDINWERLKNTLRESGTRTAAWASLAWLQMLADQSMYEDLAKQLKPGSLKTRWLGYWMGKDLNRKLEDRRFLIRVGFSLMLQDSLKDSFNAVSTLKKEKEKTAKTMRALAELEK